ncbi:glycosyltransferase WbuB [Achromobacter piechaudii]|uniref:D-inositol-3-phosphate glycosyltransferase n=1 Tax=Achromobacter piechaudii TaxID=72556 RepID=A0ABN7EZP6_9BURK|nr:glycosyltransferase WbuB [Achromobacter piechaudii]CAB3702702.1 D-inositol-3-phosphate glycosyltransferase [Achromobacter piechaudii]CAB3849636.1 D-inositol-3-phosphate glycosyltransferase [Achromobacter piechaudii]CAB3951152.1 D-inositol-3-phosphate glycosyltransferase [Achromobacter piechaudii]
MKILIYGINYAPELTGIGKYSAELAEWLAAHGHQVSVVTAPPYYPQWQVHEGYRAGRYRREERRGVTVRRAPLWVPKRPGGLKRLIHLASFAVSSLPSLLRAAASRPDLILVVEPALFCAPAAWLTARLCGARAWLHIQDYEVDAAFELGLLKGAGLRSMVKRAERWLMRRFDRVSTISHRMLDLAIAKGVEPERAVLLPNWIDVNAITPRADGGDYRAELGIPDNAIVALYSGNMGGKQGLQTLAEVARRLSRESRLWFVFCGQGPERAPLQAACQGLDRVVFLDLQPADRLGALLNTADIHLLPQRAGAADLVMPSKLTGMLASGRPVVCGAAPGTELAGVVARCGLLTPPEDAEAMAEAVRKLSYNAQIRETLGAAARLYALNNLHVDAVLAAAEREFAKVIGSRATPPAPAVDARPREGER